MAPKPLLTTCALDCPDSCSIVCTPDSGRRSGDARPGPETCRLRGNPLHPFTRGFTCAKIRRYPGRLTSPERIVQPQIRVGRSFSPISWDEAFEVIIPALGESLRADPASVLYVRSGGAEGITKSLRGLPLRRAGSPHHDGRPVRLRRHGRPGDRHRRTRDEPPKADRAGRSDRALGKAPARQLHPRGRPGGGSAPTWCTGGGHQPGHGGRSRHRRPDDTRAPRQRPLPRPGSDQAAAETIPAPYPGSGRPMPPPSKRCWIATRCRGCWPSAM